MQKYLVCVWFGGPGGVGGKRSAYMQREVKSRAKNFRRLNDRLLNEVYAEFPNGYCGMEIYRVEVEPV